MSTLAYIKCIQKLLTILTRNKKKKKKRECLWGDTNRLHSFLETPIEKHLGLQFTATFGKGGCITNLISPSPKLVFQNKRIYELHTVDSYATSTQQLASFVNHEHQSSIEEAAKCSSGDTLVHSDGFMHTHTHTHTHGGTSGFCSFVFTWLGTNM